MGPLRAILNGSRGEGLKMYVCVCNAVSDRQIRDAVDHGARTLFEVQCQLPVGACCGRCEDTASKVVSEQLENRARRNAA
jgi:bacterioferritin-associated ferredoxin